MNIGTYTIFILVGLTIALAILDAIRIGRRGKGADGNCIEASGHATGSQGETISVSRPPTRRPDKTHVEGLDWNQPGKIYDD